MNSQSNSMRGLLIFSAIVVGLMFAIAAWAWVQIPPGTEVPVHWNASFEADRYGSKAEGLLLFPVVTGLVALLLAAVPRLDPKGENIRRSMPAYRALWITLMVFFFLMYVIMVASIFGRAPNAFQLIPVGIGVLFIILGNYMGKIRPNYMFGVRTPWTLASDLAWNKTHRLAGWLFVLLGLLTILSTFAANETLWLWVLMGGVLGLLVISTVYSYTVWKDDPARLSAGFKDNDSLKDG